MKTGSTGSIRRRTNLVYRLAAALDPSCTIERDPLHRRYSVNRGVRVSCGTLLEARTLRTLMLTALRDKGIQVVSDWKKAQPSSELCVAEVVPVFPGPSGYQFELYPY